MLLGVDGEVWRAVRMDVWIVGIVVSSICSGMFGHYLIICLGWHLGLDSGLGQDMLDQGGFGEGGPRRALGQPSFAYDSGVILAHRPGSIDVITVKCLLPSA